MAVFVRNAPFKKTKQRRWAPSLCGKWQLDVTQAVGVAKRLAEVLQTEGRGLQASDLAELAQACSKRAASCRYRDPPEVRKIISLRKEAQDPEERNDLGRQVVVARAEAKRRWRTDLLERAANGDYVAISYFRKRQSTRVTHGLFSARLGGAPEAISALKAHFQNKFTPPDLPVPHLPMHMLQTRHPSPPTRSSFTWSHSRMGKAQVMMLLHMSSSRSLFRQIWHLV